MNENVERYCEGTMPEIEKKLFEFKLRTEPILKELSGSTFTKTSHFKLKEQL